MLSIQPFKMRPIRKPQLENDGGTNTSVQRKKLIPDETADDINSNVVFAVANKQ